MLDGQGLARVAKRKKTERSNFDEYERGILILLEKTDITIFTSKIFTSNFTRILQS